MVVETFCLGDLQTNAFVVRQQDSADCWIFDCPGSPEPLMDWLSEGRLRPKALFLTHAHVDHMAGLDLFRASFPGTPVVQHRAEASWLQDPQANLSVWMGPPVTAAPADQLVDEGESLVLGPWTVQLLHVPGHSPGSVAYWFASEMAVISGDVLFRSGVGRWDFPGCDRDALRRSLERLTQLPDETRVYPGHGGSTTIAREKASNPYLRSDDPWE